MKKLINSLLMLLGIVLLTSCLSTKKVTYFQNLNDVDLSKPTSLYDAKLMPKDIIYIYVHTQTPEAAETFNLKGEGSYLVDNDGNIDFPVIGTIHLGGLTTKEGEALIKSKIAPYIAESEKPIVQIRMPNYKYVVLGAVNAPGVYTAPNEKIGVIEALAKAGDIKFSGKRDKVSLIRERADGSREVHQMDVTDANILNSPYYYLQQNDIVYVEPNKVKARNSSIGQSTTLWISATSILISMASLLYNILK